MFITSKKECCDCGACFNACPKLAITMAEDKEGFLFPKINNAKCVRCNLCKKVCPVVNTPPVHEKQEIFAARDRDFATRLQSASGGVFFRLAQHTLSQNGVVFGAVFNDKMQVVHTSAENIDELHPMRGSKYVQSRIGDVFKQVRSALMNDRHVLFSGTPCQIAGLKNFLGRDYERLLLIDVVCHGVPSEKIWLSYLQEIGNGNTPVRAGFRNKENGLKNNTVNFEFENGLVIQQPYKENLFCEGFINGLYERLSCNNCKFKGIARCGDITLGDFWGIENAIPNFADDFGINLVIIHSERGKKAFADVKAHFDIHLATVNDIIAKNPMIIRSAWSDHRRTRFFSLYRKLGVCKAVIRCRTFSLSDKVADILIALKKRLKKVVGTYE